MYLLGAQSVKSERQCLVDSPVSHRLTHQHRSPQALLALTSTRTSPTTTLLQTIPAKIRLALPTLHMQTPRRLLDQMSTFRTMLPPLLLPQRLHFPRLRVLGA